MHGPAKCWLAHVHVSSLLPGPVRFCDRQRCWCRGTGRLLEAALASSTENGGDGNAAELGSAGVASALPPRYVDFKEAIRREMVAIRQKMGELRGLHGRAALTTFDDGAGHEVEIEVLTQDITRLFRKVEARLQQFGTGDATSEADEKVLPAVCPCPSIGMPH